MRDMVPVIRGDRARAASPSLMIEHVMQAVMSLAEHVWVLAEGRMIAARRAARDRRAIRA